MWRLNVNITKVPEKWCSIIENAIWLHHVPSSTFPGRLFRLGKAIHSSKGFRSNTEIREVRRDIVNLNIWSHIKLRVRMSSVEYKNGELKLKARKCVIELGNCVLWRHSYSGRCKCAHSLNFEIGVSWLQHDSYGGRAIISLLYSFLLWEAWRLYINALFMALV